MERHDHHIHHVLRLPLKSYGSRSRFLFVLNWSWGTPEAAKTFGAFVKVAQNRIERYRKMRGRQRQYQQDY